MWNRSRRDTTSIYSFYSKSDANQRGDTTSNPSSKRIIIETHCHEIYVNDKVITHRRTGSNTEDKPMINKKLTIDNIDYAKTYFNIQMNSMIYPKWHNHVMINNYEVVEEHQHTTTPHSGETCDEKLPDHLARFSSTQFESLKHFHLYDTWKRKTSEEDKIWTSINIL